MTRKKTRKWSVLMLAAVAASAWGDTSGKVVQPPRRTVLALHEINAAMVAGMRHAWDLAGRGNSEQEAAVVIVARADGAYEAVVSHDQEGYRSMRVVVPPGAVALFHTHPNHVSGEPSPQDRRNSDLLGIPNFTLTDRGVWMYDPRTRRTARVMYKLSWLESKSWQAEFQAQEEPRP